MYYSEYMDFVLNCRDPDILMHYGVKGMKWGVRKDEPKGSRRKSVPHRTLNFKKLNREIRINNLKDYAIRIMAYGVGSIYVSPLPIGVKLVTTVALGGYVLAYRTKVALEEKTNFVKKDGPKQKPKDFPKLKTREDASESLSCVNLKKPKLGNGCDRNCVSCSLAMDMRQKGYDVRARRQNNGISRTEVAKLYEGGKLKHVDGVDSKTDPQERYNKVVDAIGADGRGNSSGVMGITWTNGSGHMIYYKSEKGNVTFYDGQTGKSGPDLDSYFAMGVQYDYIRTDNKKVKEGVGDYVVRKDKESD